MIGRSSAVRCRALAPSSPARRPRAAAALQGPDSARARCALGGQPWFIIFFPYSLECAPTWSHGAAQLMPPGC